MVTLVHCPACGRPGRTAEDCSARFLRCADCGHQFTLSPSLSTAGSRRHETQGSVFVASLAGSEGGDAPAAIGRFLIRAWLGAGAFGTVYRAFDPHLQRDVAIKVPRAGSLSSPQLIERFLREARAAAQLRHPHIVPVYEAGQDGGQYYIASAFIEGQTLAAASAGGGIGFPLAARIVADLAEALDCAHQQGIVHRDVKPANILLDARGESLLMDFGLAYHQEAATKLTQEGAVLGTPAYMAPEQAQGQTGEPLPASDQYSLGVVLYELLCGRLPFQGPWPAVLFNLVYQAPAAPGALNPRVPADLERICLRAMAKQPAGRYPGCRPMAEDLRRWLAGESVAGEAGWLQRHALGLGVAIGVAGLAAAVTLALGEVLPHRGNVPKSNAEAEQASTPGPLGPAALRSLVPNLPPPPREAAPPVTGNPKPDVSVVPPSAEGIKRAPQPIVRPGIKLRAESIDPKVEQLLQDLQGSNYIVRKAAADALVRMEPNHQRAQVALALESLVADPDNAARRAGIKAFSVWGSKENTPALVKALNDPDTFVRFAILDALGHIKDPRTAEPIAEHLAAYHDRGKASQALQALGPPAEKAVLKYLTHPEVFVRVETCKILQVAAGADGRAALQGALRDKSSLVRKAAAEALRALGKGP